MEVAPSPTLPKTAGNRRVGWVPQVSVILIPCRQEYYSLPGMARRLWYGLEDYEIFKWEAGNELRECVAVYGVSPMVARQILYGQQHQYMDDHDTWAVGGMPLSQLQRHQMLPQKQASHAKTSVRCGGQLSNNFKSRPLRAPSISLINDGKISEKSSSRSFQFSTCGRVSCVAISRYGQSYAIAQERSQCERTRETGQFNDRPRRGGVKRMSGI